MAMAEKISTEVSAFWGIISEILKIYLKPEMFGARKIYFFILF
jgi:hypothetical protein